MEYHLTRPSGIPLAGGIPLGRQKIVHFIYETNTYKKGHMAMECHLGGPGGVRHVISTKALGVEGHIALCAHIHSLSIFLSHLEAHLAIPSGCFSMFVELSLNYPMVHSVIPVNIWCIYVGR